MLGWLAAAIMIVSWGILYLAAWAVVLIVGWLLPLPDSVRPALPWLLLQVYLVVSLFSVGDLPGSRRGIACLMGLMAVASLVPGIIYTVWRRPTAWKSTLSAFVGAGVLPWLAALLIDLVV